MKEIRIIVLVLVAYMPAFAQPDWIDRDINYAIKWSPLHLIAKCPTLQIGLEQRISKRISFQYEAGVPCKIKNLNGLAENNSHLRGFKVKFEVRRYFNIKDFDRFYLGQEIFYNHIDYTTGDDFTVHPDLDDQTKDYNQRMNYDVHYREAGTFMKVGVNFLLHGLCIDIHGGLVASYLVENEINRPESPTYSQAFPDNGPIIGFFELEDIKNAYVYPRLGIRLGYIIK